MELKGEPAGALGMQKPIVRAAPILLQPFARGVGRNGRGTRGQSADTGLGMLGDAALTARLL